MSIAWRIDSEKRLGFAKRTATPGHARYRILENLQALSANLRLKDRLSGDVSIGPGEALGNIRANGVSDYRYNNGNRRGGALGRPSRRPVLGHDNVNPETNKLGGQFGQPIEVPIGPSELDDDVLALEVAKVAQPRPQRFDLGGKS